MDFASVVKNLRLVNDCSQESFARKLGVSTVAVQCWERGTRKPSFDAMASLCDTFHVSMDELLGIRRPMLIPPTTDKQESNLLRSYRMLDRFGKRAVDVICREELRRVLQETNHRQEKPAQFRTLRRFFVPAAAGYSAPIDGEDYEMISVSEEVPKNADYAVNIQGNSTAPYIFDGDMVFVEKNAELNIGDVGIFCVDGSFYCKIYYRGKDGSVTLVSANESLRETNIHIAPDSGESLECLGRVLLDTRVQLPSYFSGNAD